jgi:hypothetical protein
MVVHVEPGEHVGNKQYAKDISYRSVSISNIMDERKCTHDFRSKGLLWPELVTVLRLLYLFPVWIMH